MFSSLSPFNPTTIDGNIHKILIYIQHIFIVIGFLFIFLNKIYKRNIAKNIFDKYMLITLFNSILLLFIIIIPNISLSLGMKRFYQIIIPLLSPFLIIGCQYTFQKIKIEKHYKKFIVFILLMSYLFQVGLINYITNDYPYSYILDLERKKNSNDTNILMTTYGYLNMEQDVFGAEWLSWYIDNTSMVYSDVGSITHVLKSYALLHDKRLKDISGLTESAETKYLYFKYLNTKLGIIPSSQSVLNMSEMTPLINDSNKLYSNGGSEVLYFINN